MLTDLPIEAETFFPEEKVAACEKASQVNQELAGFSLNAQKDISLQSFAVASFKLIQNLTHPDLFYLSGLHEPNSFKQKTSFTIVAEEVRAAQAFLRLTPG